MGIKEVGCIKKKYTEMIRDDFDNLIKNYNRPMYFEFTGDYNYKYLDVYAREEARVLFITLVAEIKKQVNMEVAKELNVQSVFGVYGDTSFSNKFLRIYKRGNHVYGYFNPFYISSGQFRKEYHDAVVLKNKD